VECASEPWCRGAHVAFHDFQWRLSSANCRCLCFVLRQKQLTDNVGRGYAKSRYHSCAIFYFFILKVVSLTLQVKQLVMSRSDPRAELVTTYASMYSKTAASIYYPLAGPEFIVDVV